MSDRNPRRDRNSRGPLTQDSNRSDRENWMSSKEQERPKREYRGSRGSNDSRSSYDNSRDRARDQRRYSRKEEDQSGSFNDAEPNACIMLRGLHPATTSGQVREAVERFGFVSAIKLVREHNTGVNRGIAFIDYKTLDDAKNFMLNNKESEHSDGKGRITIDGTNVEIRYSRPKRDNWTCMECGCSNFPRRTECFDCRAPKKLPPQKKPSKCKETLSVFNLSSDTSKRTIFNYFNNIRPVKSVKMLLDKDHRVFKGTAFVEFFNDEDAKTARTKATGNVLAGATMKIGYANYNNSETDAEQEIVPNLESQAKYSAYGGVREERRAEHSRRDDSSHYRDRHASGYPQQSYDESRQEHIQQQPYNGESAVTGSLGVHDERDFVFDTQKGGYFNPKSNFYFDSSSGYFYETTTGFYYYYDTSCHTYIPYTSNNTANSSSTSENTSNQSNQSQVDYTAAAAILEQAQARTKIHNQAQAQPLSHMQSNQSEQSRSHPQSQEQIPSSLQFDIPHKSTKVKDIRVQKDINKWNAKTQELRTHKAVNSMRPTHSDNVQEHARVEKIEILNKAVLPISHQQQHIASHDMDMRNYSQPHAPDVVSSLPPLLSEEEIMEQLKRQFEPTNGAICLLCKRNLSTTEKLLIHYQLSTLHSDNLAVQLQQRLIKQQLVRNHKRKCTIITNKK